MKNFFGAILLVILAVAPAARGQDDTGILPGDSNLTESLPVSSEESTREIDDVSGEPEEVPVPDAVVEEEDVLGGLDDAGLLLDEKEESLFKGIVEETPPVQDVASELDSGTVSDTVDSIMPGVAGEDTVVIDEKTVVSPSAPAVLPRQQSRAVDIEDVRSINFAKNLKEYRSPKLAMLMSLIIPGLGQAYTRKYWKTAVFGVLEATIIGVSIAYNVKGRNAVDNAHRYADTWFDTTRFEAYYDSLRLYAEKNYFVSGADSAVGEWMNAIYFHFDTQKTFIENFNSEARKKTQDYYAEIESNKFVQGWEDCEPSLGQIERAGPGAAIDGEYGGYTVSPVDTLSFMVVRDGGDPGIPVFGYSQYQDNYINMISDANRYYRNSGSVLVFLLLNHLCSAIDAGISAKRHNDRLLSRQSFWDRIDIQQQWVNTGSEISPGYAINIRF